MALSKSVAAVDEWAEIAQNAVREGATTNVAATYAATLYINCAISSTTPHTGTKVEIQLSSNSSGDEDWHTFRSFVSSSGTANSEILAGVEAAGQTVLEVASTTGYDADEARWIFIEDVGTVADSEIAYLVSHVSNTSVTVQDGITNAKDGSDFLFNIVDTWVVDLPFSANRVRVIYDNTFDSDGSTVHTFCRIATVTGI